MNAKAKPVPVEKPLGTVPGTEPGARLDAWWGLVALVVVIAGAMILLIPDPFGRIFNFVLDGIGITIFVTVISFVLVMLVGLIGGLGRLSKNRVIYGISSLYVELVRGVPLMVQLLYWYFAMPVIIQTIGRALQGAAGSETGLLSNLSGAMANYQANAILMAVIGLVFCYGAYMSEIYRAGIQSIPKGQMEAARSLGMTYVQAMVYVILPQAIRVILPPVGNEFISLLKDSSLVSVVAVTDLTRRGREFMSTNFNPIETWTLVALLYLVMTLLSARFVSLIERVTKFER